MPLQSGMLDQPSQVLPCRFPRNTTSARHNLVELLSLADNSSTPVIVGFDSETPVKWAKDDDGKFYSRNDLPVALLQLSYHPVSSTVSRHTSAVKLQ
jgi:hypothetical protein